MKAPSSLPLDGVLLRSRPRAVAGAGDVPRDTESDESCAEALNEPGVDGMTCMRGVVIEAEYRASVGSAGVITDRPCLDEAMAASPGSAVGIATLNA